MINEVQLEWLELFTNDVEDIWKSQPLELRIMLAMYQILQKEFKRVEHDFNNKIECLKSKMKCAESFDSCNYSNESSDVISVQSSCIDLTLPNSPKIKRHRSKHQRHSRSPSLLNVPKENLSSDSFSPFKSASPVYDNLSETSTSLLMRHKSERATHLADGCDLVDTSIILDDTSDKTVRKRTKLPNKYNRLTQLVGTTKRNVLEENTEKCKNRENQILKRQPKSNFFQNYDKVSIPKSNTPEHPHKTEVVRRKIDRMNLPGWSCMECQKYYEGFNLPLDELRDKMNKCSKHRNKFEPFNETPKGFWDITMCGSQHD